MGSRPEDCATLPSAVGAMPLHVARGLTEDRSPLCATHQHQTRWLRDNLCLTPAMGCAHMGDLVHVVLRLYTRCQQRLKKTESNKCSAVAMWMLAKTTSTWRLTLCQLCTHTVKESSYSPFEIHICCSKQLAKQPGSSPTFGSSYELQTIWTENNYKSN